MQSRVLINGKKAGNEFLRSAIFDARKRDPIDVRVTWESGDIARLVHEACQDGCRRLIAAGGDGTVNEMVSALMQIKPDDRPEMAILPLGTANDFATACGIPPDSTKALALAQTGEARAIDAGVTGGHYFINVASGGFGARVTASTPAALKNFLGGGAYTLNGLTQALKFSPYRGIIRLPTGHLDDAVIASAICNGRLAGGGQSLAPNAMLDDGLLDVVALYQFPLEAIVQVLDELRDPECNGQYVKRYRVEWVEWQANDPMPINLDGEPFEVKQARFEVLPAAISLVLPDTCKLVKQGK